MHAMEDYFQVKSNRCCYLLRSLNPDHANRSYVGSTEDALARLKQHNGLEPGGAKETERLGRPWEFVAIVDGFPDNTDNADGHEQAKKEKFEKAWQTPNISLLVRDAIGDTEADALSERKGIEGKLAVLKCLVEEYNIFSKYSLRVNFFQEKWRDEYLKVKYIDDDDEHYDDDDNQVVLTTPPTMIYSESYDELLCDLRARNFKDQEFRWEILDNILESMKDAATQELITPDQWRRLNQFSKAVRRADKRCAFLDEYENHLLLGDEYNLIERISQMSRFYDFYDAINSDAILLNEDRDDSSNSLEEVMTRFGYKSQFDEYKKKNSSTENDGESIDLVKNFIRREKRRLHRQAPKVSEIQYFIEKLELAKATVPTQPPPTTRKRKSQAPSSRQVHNGLLRSAGSANNSKRTKFTPVEVDAIQNGVDKHGTKWVEIKNDPEFSEDLKHRTKEQICDKWKNILKKKREDEAAVSYQTVVSTAPSKQQKIRKEYTGDEDDAIRNGEKRYGRRWEKILEEYASILEKNGRTAEGIRKRYDNVIAKKKGPALQVRYIK